MQSIEGVYMKNEIMGLQCITRKVVEAYLKCAILTLGFEERRKGYDSHGKQATYAGRSGRATSGHTAYSQAVHCFRSTRGCSSWRRIPCKARGTRPLHSQKHLTGNRQKIKPPRWWQWKQFTAVRLPLKVLANARDNPRINLPAFSIALLSNQSQWLCEMWAYERRCAHE